MEPKKPTPLEASPPSPSTTAFIRDSLDDDGSLPNNGAINSSPDIIPQTAQVAPNLVQDTFGLSSFLQDLGQNIEMGQTNYIYMRAINLLNQQQSGNLSLYWAKGSTLQHPTQWQQIGTSQEIILPACINEKASVVAAAVPAMWLPQQLPQAGHYCLILEFIPDGQSGIPSDFPSLDAWWDYCRQHNNIAQRNMEVINDLPDNRVERWLDLLNPDPNYVNHAFEADYTVPVGSQITLYSPSPQLTPPINVSVTTTTPSGTLKTGDIAFPPNFQGQLQMIFQPPGKNDPGEFSIIVQQFADINTPLAKVWQGQRSIDNEELVLLGSYVFEIQLS